MKKKNSLAKRITAVALSAMFLAVSILPSYPSMNVEAASSDKFPEDVHFPIQILDFKADNLLFEYMEWGSSMSLGRGYVAEELEYDEETGIGYPKYTQKAVEEIAANVQKILEGAERGDASQMPVLDTLTITDETGAEVPNPISLYTWITSSYPAIHVLDEKYANQYRNNMNPAPALTQASGFLRWTPGDSGRWQDNTIWPAVYNGGNKQFSVEYDGLVLEPNVSVSQTFGEIPAGVPEEEYEERINKNSSYTISMDKTNQSKIHVLVDGVEKEDGDSFTTKADGTTTVTIKSDNTAMPASANIFGIGSCVPGGYSAANQNIFVKNDDNYGQMTYGKLEGGAVTVNRYGNILVNLGDGSATYRIYSNQKTNTNIKLYASTGNAGIQFNVSVNGSTPKSKTVNNPNTTTPGDAVEIGDFSLNQGINTIVVKATGTGNRWLDGIELSKAEGVEYILCPAEGTEEYNRFGNNYRTNMYNTTENGWLRIEAESNTSPYWDTWTTGHGQFNRNEGGNYSNGAALQLYDDTSFGDYQFYSDSEGDRTARFSFPDAWGRTSFTLTVNGTTQTVPIKEGKASASIRLRQGMNDIRVAATVGAFDYFEISTDRLDYKVSNILLEEGGGKYPLGKYSESEARYKADPDLGYFKGMSCMDYAYFVTSHFFKYKSGYNDVFNQYKELIFHKVVEKGQISYEFAADQHHPDMKLIYNQTDGTIRNASETDPGNTADGDDVRDGGSMFVVDERTERPYKDMDRDYQGHNFHYSIASRSKFVYKKNADQYFYFSGDDDVYVYVNGHLYMDMGGTHEQEDDSVNLDELAALHPDWGIEDGKVVDLDLFYMERHTVASNFYSKMNFKLAQDEVDFKIDYINEKTKEISIPYGLLVPLDYSFASMRELTTNSQFRIEDNFGNVIGADKDPVYNDDGTVKIDPDDGLPVHAGGLRLKQGISIAVGDVYQVGPDGYAAKDASGNYIVATDDSGEGKVGFVLNIRLVDANNKEKVKQFVFAKEDDVTTEESNAVRDFFTNLSMTQGEKMYLEGLQYDSAYQPYKSYKNEEYVEQDGAMVGVGRKKLDFETTILYQAQQVGAEPAPNSDTKVTPVYILIGSLKITVSRTSEKKNLDDFGKFKVTRQKEAYKNVEFTYTNNPNKLTAEADTDAAKADVNLDGAAFEGTRQLDRDEYVLAFDNKASDGDDPKKVTGVEFTQLSRGKYRLDLDPNVLTSYDVYINGESRKYFVLELEPVWDGENWNYPEIELEVKAVRAAPDLNDLT